MPIRQYVTYGNLVKVIDLPDEFQNSMLEVTVRPMKNMKSDPLDEFFGCINDEDANVMMDALNECRRIEPNEW